MKAVEWCSTVVHALEFYRDNKEKISQLEVDLSTLKQEANDAAEAWHEQVRELKADLAKYGGHQSHCGAYKGFPGSVYPDVGCACGWAEIEKGQGVK